VPGHYEVGPFKKKDGRVIHEPEDEKDRKLRMRMKDLHETLSKNIVCILPEADQHFADHMPIFQIFTADPTHTLSGLVQKGQARQGKRGALQGAGRRRKETREDRPARHPTE